MVGQPHSADAGAGQRELHDHVRPPGPQAHVDCRGDRTVRGDDVDRRAYLSWADGVLATSRIVIVGANKDYIQIAHSWW